MFRLTREVRFAVNDVPDEQLSSRPTNSFGGYPSLTGSGQYFALRVTLAGELHARTQYLLNIKEVDETVRRRAVRMVIDARQKRRFGGGAEILRELFDLLRSAWPGVALEALQLCLTPTLRLHIHTSEHPMIRLSQKFEFSASHQLHNPAFSDDENRKTFGKCSNPHGHGHNYEVEVTLVGEPDERGVLMNVPQFERIVADTVIEPFDHKNLNVEVPEFHDVMPSVENIAKVIFHLLKSKFANSAGKLASVTVWETPKTWCEYSD